MNPVTSARFFNRRRLLVFCFDTVLVGLAFSFAFLLRFDFHIPENFEPLFKQGLVVVLLVKPLVFLFSGLYRSLWRYASLQDGIEIAKTVSIASVVAGFMLMFIRHFAPYPRSIFILDWFLLMAMVVASRLVWRVYRETILIPRLNSCGKRTLIIGAGDAASMLMKEIRKQEDSPFTVVGFVDDDHQKQGMKLHGLPVLGQIDQLATLIERYAVEDVIIAIPSAGTSLLRDLVKACEHSKVRFKTLPAISDIIEGKVSVSQIKDVEIEDLLGRAPVVLDVESIRGYLTGKRVLVTGAAGSIGSELCRQICQHQPAKIVLLDNAETPLYQIEKELISSFPELYIIPIIADVRNSDRVAAIFDSLMPQVVFHAAAYKHVPMMEYNPMEAVSNNVGGTVNLVNVAHASGVEQFVMISTDKAVNPTNVMGASKRAAELFVQASAQHSRTCFTTVRFGNVLGSNGSVIPLFKEQILRGGPVTVTDPKVIRYFMTIPEACQLVLQAGCLGRGGDIFVLDMGEPVRILDLAEELIRLSGLTPHEDIEIVFTGLRPGEKLFEELLVFGEGIMPTSHEKIRVLGAMRYDFETVRDQIASLLQIAASYDTGAVLEALKRTVPEFTPRYHFNGKPPLAFKRLRPDVDEGVWYEE
ncbi:MAG: polysaccharide biosynthesis protein [Desulfobacter sp.]